VRGREGLFTARNIYSKQTSFYAILHGKFFFQINASVKSIRQGRAKLKENQRLRFQGLLSTAT
jgi:hypothetical protein